jgi:hypothetical protein
MAPGAYRPSVSSSWKHFCPRRAATLLPFTAWFGVGAEVGCQTAYGIGGRMRSLASIHTFGEASTHTPRDPCVPPHVVTYDMIPRPGAASFWPLSKTSLQNYIHPPGEERLASIDVRI